jgi:hypothetical protein
VPAADQPQGGQLGVAIETEAEFEAARQEAGRLISGTVADWRAAREEAKVVYAMISAASLRPGAQRDGRTVSVFKTCMEASASQASPAALLSDLSYECAQVLQRNGL